MKKYVSKISFVFFLSFFMTGCFSVKDTTTFETSGKFSSNTIIDLSKLQDLSSFSEGFLDGLIEELEEGAEKEVYLVKKRDLQKEKESNKMTCEKLKAQMKESGNLESESRKIYTFNCKELAPGKFSINTTGLEKENFSYENGVFKLKLSADASVNTSSADSDSEADELSEEMMKAMGFEFNQKLYFPGKVLKSNFGKIKENSVSLTLPEMAQIKDYLIVEVDMKNEFNKVENSILPQTKSFQRTTKKTTKPKTIKRISKKMKQTTNRSQSYNKSRSFRQRIMNRKSRIKKTKTEPKKEYQSPMRYSSKKATASSKRKSLKNEYKYLFAE